MALKALGDHEVLEKVKEEIAKVKVTGEQPDLTGMFWSGEMFELYTAHAVNTTAGKTVWVFVSGGL